jgi:hypothetical protein
MVILMTEYKRQYLPETYTQTREFCSDYSTSSYPFVWDIENRSGEAVPRYKERIKALEDASSSYTRSGRKYYPGTSLCSVGFETQTCGEWFEVWNQDYVPYYSRVVPPSFSTDVLNAARSKFLSNAVNATRPFQGLVALGELRETLEMIKHPAVGLRNLISRKARGLKAKGIRKVTSDTWLEWTFGWAPFMSDIKAACEVYVQFADDVRVIHTSASDKNAVNPVVQDRNIQHPNYFYLKESTKLQDEYTARCGGAFKVRYGDIDRGSADRIIQLSGLSWKDVPSSLWELMPWSFLIDYFTNIGEILNGWHARYLDWIYTYTSQTRCGSAVSNRRFDRDNPIYKAVASSSGLEITSEAFSEARLENFVFQRSPSVDMSLPAIYATLPPLGMQWANMIALISSIR